MATEIERKQTTFRVCTCLLNKLREAAERENLSLNNYVEKVLMDAVFSKTNKLTLAAMKETRENRNLETLDVNNLDSVIASLFTLKMTSQYKKDLKRIQNNPEKIELLLYNKHVRCLKIIIQINCSFCLDKKRVKNEYSTHFLPLFS